MEVDKVVPLTVQNLVRLTVARAVDLGAGRRASRVRDLRRGLAVAVPLRRVRLGSRLSGSCRRAARGAGCARAGATTGRARRRLVALGVALVGLAPASAPAFWSALPPPEACVETESCLSCPGALAEFPAAAWEAGSVAEAVWVSALALPLPFPLPLPARAEPVNAAMPRASRITLVRLAIRFVISFSPRFRTTLLEGLRPEKRVNNPYGYGLQELFPWI